eukprot:15463251-Alexandrium_andersonii.AAC.1
MIRPSLPSGFLRRPCPRTDPLPLPLPRPDQVCLDVCGGKVGVDVRPTDFHEEAPSGAEASFAAEALASA